MADRHKETNDFLKNISTTDQTMMWDPFKDLADSFNGLTPVNLESEVKRLREANKKLQRTLNETQRNLDKLKSNVNVTCQEMLKILRDGENYGHLDDK